MALDAVLNPDQRAFITSTERFPCFKGGWSDGKTMCGIVKIFVLAQMYKNNLLVICRKSFTNLKASTMKDWELYTGIRPKVQAKEAIFPNGSVVIFSHADDVAGIIQNINLGGFMIEQGEEFDDSDVFTMMSRGRLRRKLQLDEKAWEALDRAHAEEPPKPDMKAFYDYLRSHTGDYALNQGIVIANANGRNWIWNGWKRDATATEINEHSRKWVNPNRPGFMMIESSTFANERNLKPDFAESLRAMEHGTETEQRKYRMYVLNLDDEIDLEGAYYAKLMSEARVEGRIGRYKPDPSHATYTAWDLGVSDTTAIWFFQKIGQEVRHVHYYENNGEGIEHYVRYLEEVRKRLKLYYGQHFWPHDGKKRSADTGKELHQTAKDMGLIVTLLNREKKVTDGIERVRKMLPDCTYDEKECKKGIEAMEHYQRKKNEHMSTEEKTQFSDIPLHDWSSNCADSARYVSMAIRKIGGGMSKDRVRELVAAYS